MPKLKLRGIIKEVSAVEFVGPKATKHQKISFLVPGYVDSYGEKLAKDQLWPINVFGEHVDEFDLLNKNLMDAKAELGVYLNANSVEKDGEIKSFINANLRSLELR